MDTALSSVAWPRQMGGMHAACSSQGGGMDAALSSVACSRQVGGMHAARSSQGGGMHAFHLLNVGVSQSI